MAETVVTELDLTTVPEAPEVSDEELEAVVGGAYSPGCTCTNAGCVQ